jgi:hypothetical protein
LFSSVTKNGRDEILKILENFIIETIWIDKTFILS